MATYEQYMNAARNADAQGDEDAARQLVQAAIRVRDEAKSAEKADRTFGEMLYENIVGEGEVDTFGERVGDVIGSGFRGLVRGGIAAAELPEMAGRAVVRAGEIATGAESRTPILETKTGQLLESGYNIVDPIGPELAARGQTLGGQFAGTVGEFVGGGVGFAPVAGAVSKGLRAAGAARGADIAADIGRAGLTKSGMRAAAGGGIASEAAGQLTEGTAAEPYARIVGAFAGPAAVSRAGKVYNKTAEALRQKNFKSPALETAEQSKNKAWDEFEQVAGKLAINMDDVNKNLGLEIAANRKDLFVGYSAGAKGDAEYIDEAIKMVAAHTGDTFNASQLNNLVRELNNVYRKSGYKPQVAFIRDNVKNTLDTKATQAASVLGGDAGDLLKNANAESRKYYKIKMFDEAMDKAKRNVASTGSGGNVVNTYKQAIKNILNNPKNRMQFDQDEIIMMERFVRGSMTDNMLRLMSKLSPTGNGLMAALNVGAAAANPAMLGVTAAGMTAKGVIDRKTLSAVDQIKDTIISGVRPQFRDKLQKDITKAIGLSAGSEQ
jgi:hypothetical protein